MSAFSNCRHVSLAVMFLNPIVWYYLENPPMHLVSTMPIRVFSFVSVWFFFVIGMTVTLTMAFAAADDTQSCDVVWNSPSIDARGSMPIGNGEVGVNAWAEPSGDLQFYISRSDSYSEVSRLLKVGLIKIALLPNPFANGLPFVQHLHINDGYIEFRGGSPGSEVNIRLFVDADQPVIHCEAWSQVPEEVMVSVESWRTTARTLTGEDLGGVWTMAGAPYPLVESADHFDALSPVEVAWYHRNETSCVPATMSLQGIDTAPAGWHDPLLHRTFGGLVTGTGLVAIDPQTMRTKMPLRYFALQIACPCAQTGTPQEWIGEAQLAQSLSHDPNAALSETEHWWHTYWNTAWVRVTGDVPTIAANSGPSPSLPAASLTQAYCWQRYMQACGGRGNFPIKFNGGEFTVSPEGTMTYADTRHWGDAHWWQNIRHIYYPMLAEGNFDMMQPFFRMYENAVPIGEARAKFAEHVGGCFFPETMSVWGTYANSDYGWNQAGPSNTGIEASPWHTKTRNQGPELVEMMLDYWDYTQDKTFLETELVPMAKAVLTYFDNHSTPIRAGSW